MYIEREWTGGTWGSGAGVELVILLEAASGHDSSPDWTAHRLQLGGSPRASQSSYPPVCRAGPGDTGASNSGILLVFWPVLGPEPHKGFTWVGDYLPHPADG